MASPAIPASLGPTEVHVWECDLAGAPDEETVAVLSIAERERAERFAFERDRRRYANSHAALRRILALYVRRDPAAIELATGGHGKPCLAGDNRITFNLSHGGDIALVAIGSGQEVGVDVEPEGPRSSLSGLATAVFTPGEIASLEGLDEVNLLRAFLTAWTRKEAVLKAIGLGLAGDPRTIHVGTHPDRRLVAVDASHGVPSVEVATIPLRSRGVGAVAVVGRLDSIVLSQWRA